MGKIRGTLRISRLIDLRRETFGRVENNCGETVDSNLHFRHFFRTTFIRLIGALRRYVIVGPNTLD